MGTDQTMMGGQAGVPGASLELSGGGEGPVGPTEPPHLLPPQGSCGPMTQAFCAAVEKKNPKENAVSIVTRL